MLFHLPLFANREQAVQRRPSCGSNSLSGVYTSYLSRVQHGSDTRSIVRTYRVRPSLSGRARRPHASLGHVYVELCDCFWVRFRDVVRVTEVEIFAPLYVHGGGDCNVNGD